MADRHVAGVEARIAQRDRGAAPDMKAVCAVRHHRLFFRQFTHPLAHTLGVAPGDALGDVLLPRNEVLRPRVVGWVPARVARRYRIGRGTVLEGYDPGVLLPPPKRLRLGGEVGNPLRRYMTKIITIARMRKITPRPR